MTLIEIQSKIEAIAKVIKAPANLLPTYGYSEDFARPHIEVEGNFIHYAIVERGRELDRKSHYDLNEILYIVFSHVTFTMASDYECRHRIRGVDVRRLLFNKQMELLRTMNPEWEKRMEKEKDLILKNHPFLDA